MTARKRKKKKNPFYEGIRAGLLDAIAGRYTVYNDGPVDVQALRERLGLTQEMFAKRFCVPIATVRNWEQRHRIPDGAAQAYLRVIDKNPNAVLHALT